MIGRWDDYDPPAAPLVPGARPGSPPRVTIVSDARQLSECRAALAKERIIALDCEGIDLSRFGTLSIVQVRLRTHVCFIFDVLNVEVSSPVVRFLKHLLEKKSVIKVIHDCRMDSDALYHLLGIRLQGVHDTQFWCGEELNLNSALEKYGLPPNKTRDKSVYEGNPAFWATRPLTRTMIEWAAEDTRSLLALYEAQLREIGPDWAAWIAVQDWRLSVYRDGVADIVEVQPGMVGLFIGPKGAKINSVRASTGAIFQRVAATYRWMLYAPDPAALNRAKWAVQRCLVEPPPSA